MAQTTDKLPTSTFDVFKQQLETPNTPFDNLVQNNTGEKVKMQKNLVISYTSDSTGCGHIRNIFPMTYLNATFGKSGKFNLLSSPIMIYQHEILQRARSIFFQRTMAPQQLPAVQRYKQLQQKYRFKMVYDIDDFIWNGPDEGEHIPPYNFGGEKIGQDIRDSSVAIMKLMDTVCVSTKFLGEYVAKLGIDRDKIVVVPNAVPKYFWNRPNKKPITEKIKKPSVIYTGSPTHYHNGKKLPGDLGNAWNEWITKAVMMDKIDFTVMGGLPFMFEGIKDKIKIIPWVNSFQYHLPVMDTNANFSIGPLVPNYFNYSKSDIKSIEAYASGSLFIGTTFTNDKPSPYDNCFLTQPDNCTVDDIQSMIDKYCEPENYNEILTSQYEYMVKGGRYLESTSYVNMLTKVF